MSIKYRRAALDNIELPVADALRHDAGRIGPEAIDMGRPLYEKYGFTGVGGEMALP